MSIPNMSEDIPNMSEAERRDIAAKSAADVKTRGRGRPAGTCKPRPLLLVQHTVRMTDGEWAWCEAQGNASEYLRRLMREDRARHSGRLAECR